MSTFDLTNLPSQYSASVSVVRAETGWELAVRLFKDTALFVLAAGSVVLIIWFCYFTLAVNLNASAEEKKWAMSVLSAIGSGLVGYLIKK